MRLGAVLVIFLTLFSCGKSENQKVDNAIEDANIFLTSRNCDEAIEVLQEVGAQPTNKRYLSTLSSAYACKANYSTVTFFTNDLTNISSATADGFVSSLVNFSTSDDMTSPTSDEYVWLQLAIDTLLYAGGITSASSAGRGQFFTSTELLDINTQALYMLFVNLGRWLRYYGNPDATGTKGAGAGANSCIATYTDANAIIAIDGVGGDSCNSGTNVGSVDIETADRTARLCQIITMYNNLVDTIDGVVFTGSSSTDLNGITGLLSNVCTLASADNVAGSYDVSMCSIRDQSTCEAQSNQNIERFMAAIVETIYL